MTQTVNYRVIETIDSVELRDYPAIVLATVYDMSDDDAFSILFGYIAGRNRSSSRIEMTAPVVSSEHGQRIPMTAPVISDHRQFSFVLPTEYSIETAPQPLDSRVRIECSSKRRVAVLRFRGRTRDEQVARKAKLLLDTLEKARLQPRGEVFLMRYNPPFIPGFMRRNEVGVEVTGPA